MNIILFNLKTDSDDSILGFTTDWVNALANHFDKIFVVSMFVGTVNVAENVYVVSVGQEQGYSKARRLWEFYRCVLRILKQEKIDACFAHMIPIFAVMAWPILKLMNIPILLWYAHGNVPLMLRIAGILVDSIVTSSKLGCRLNTNKIRCIGQGINLTRNIKDFDNFKKFKMNLLYVGRVSRVKGVDLIVDAMAEYNRKKTLSMPVANLTIVGGTITNEDNIYLEEIKEKISSQKLGMNVIITGSVPYKHVDKFYRENDVFINPSNTGSMDKTVLEAMANGLLVVTGNVAFNNMEFRQAGGIFTKNKIDEITKTLLNIAGYSEIERRKLTERSILWVRREHGLIQLAQKVANIIHEIVLKRRK